jgi:hypothetical protein
MKSTNSSSFASEWPIAAKAGSFAIEECKSTPTTHSLPPSNPSSRIDTTPIKADWNTRLVVTPDSNLQKGTLTPDWTTKGDPLAAQWPSVQTPSFEHKDFDAKPNTTYHIYYAKCRRHCIITTVKRTKKKGKCRLWRFARKNSGKNSGIEAGIEKGLISDSKRDTSFGVDDVMTEDFPPEKSVQEEGYFIHKPVWYKHRPRTFRRGTSKGESTILAELPKAFLWRKFRTVWLDGRGDESGLIRDAEDFRLPECEQSDKDKDVTELVWARPFSKKCREYRFTFGDIEFLWKGTGTVSATGIWKSWARYNHLKLVAKIPVNPQSPDLSIPCPIREVCLAKFTSCMRIDKAGVLEVFDDVVEWLWQEYLTGEKRKIEGSFDYGPNNVKESRFWNVLMTTALWMIFGEWQKRETVREIIAVLASAAHGV